MTGSFNSGLRVVGGLLGLMLLVTACSDDSESADAEGTTTSAPVTATTSSPPTLEERIVADMQGAQHEVFENSTTETGFVFFHEGNWATEAQPLGDGEYCERATYEWSVVEATSESEFTIRYDVLTEDPDCLPLDGASLVFDYLDARSVDGEIQYDIAFIEPFDLSGTRTTCAGGLRDPEPCGFPLPGFDPSSPPPQ